MFDEAVKCCVGATVCPLVLRVVGEFKVRGWEVERWREGKDGKGKDGGRVEMGNGDKRANW